MRKPKKFGFYGLAYNIAKYMPICSEKDSFKKYVFFRENEELYYDKNKKSWVTKKDYTGHCYPDVAPVHSLKAAINHLKRHNEIPKGTSFVLVSKYVGCDIFLTKK